MRANDSLEDDGFDDGARCLCMRSAFIVLVEYLPVYVLEVEQEA